jgi:hypothetical protein
VHTAPSLSNSFFFFFLFAGGVGGGGGGGGGGGKTTVPHKKKMVGQSWGRDVGCLNVPMFVVATSRPLLKLAQFLGRWWHFPISPLQVCTQLTTFYYKCSVLKSQWDILQQRMLFRLELILPWHTTDYSLSIWLPMLRKTSKFSTRTPSWLAKLQTTELPNMKQSSDLWHSEWVHKPPAQVELELPWRVITEHWANFPKHCDTPGQTYCT